ncbi:2',3'-cyclic-nucleotide 2'-phosphodiesterase / 3'-nucleotidase [Ruegeria marina]|uniref:2',3'-cyclic-nucleotide 2'-phosphodiesterase / 3'-nucleotidase n=2 Tax=Ruegeria marina TaxID=639004 RepID=A0A1G7AB20_9RHOB|nr:2',3'-cyclic-nucleotide 2'-phosphodiesterase / 3'-nucleotidase [Ruegeria marina]
MQLTGFDYYADRPETGSGLTRLATLINLARSEPGVDLAVLLDNGDSLQGTPMGDVFHEVTDLPHPLISAFDHLRYDAIGLGNHDFDFGLDALGRVLAQAPCPVVCSNALLLTGKCPWSETLVLKRVLNVGGESHSLAIGLVAVLPPQTAQWNAHHLDGKVKIADIVETVRIKSAQLKAQGSHLVVVLAHSGLGETCEKPHQENAVIPLAALDTVDAIVAGHTHLRFPATSGDMRPHVAAEQGMIHGKPVVMPGQFGSHLGVIDLDILPNHESGWKIARATASLRSVDDRTPHAKDLLSLLSPAHEATRQAANRPAGHSGQELHSYFCFAAPDRVLAKVAAAQAAATRSFLQGKPEATLPLLSAASPLKAGGRSGPGHYTHVPAGDLTLRHVSDLYMFPNELRAVVATGAVLREWLEMAAGVFCRIDGGSRDYLLLNDAMPGHNFDVLHGLSYEIDLSVSARYDHDGAVVHPQNHRIRDLTWNDEPVRDDQRFVVALNNYRANGGGHYRMLASAKALGLPTLSIRSALCDYLSGRLPRDPLEDAPPPWRFSPQPGHSAVLRTSPRARDHVADLPDRRTTDLGVDDQGFLCLKLDL